MPRRQANGEGERPVKAVYDRDTRRWVRTDDPARRPKNPGATRWQSRYSVMVDGHQKRYLVTGTTAKDVRTRVSTALTALDAGAPTDQRQTFGAFATQWRETILPAEGLAPATERWYCDVLDHYVLPALGTRRLRGPGAVTVGDIETMTGALGTRGLSPRVQRAARVTASKVLHAAHKRNLVDRNAARLASPPRDAGRAKPEKALRAEQVHAVLTAVKDTRWHPVVGLGFATGLRPAELLALHWRDVHLEGTEPHLVVRHALSFVGSPNFKAPKRARSNRTVPLPPFALTLLRSWRKAQAAERLAAGPSWSDSWPDLIFTTPDGRPQRIDSYRIAVGRLVRSADLPHFHPHQTRHTFATHLLEAGEPIHHVAELMGDTVATVEAAYSHVLRPKHETAAVIATLLPGYGT